MSLNNSDDYAMPDGVPVDPLLEATVMPKFDMHLYRSCLDEKHVKWLVKCYGIPEDLHPRVAPAVMTMDRLFDNAIRLYVHHFRRGGSRVPFSTFFLKVMEYFCVHISQLVLISVNHASIFEVYCRALDIVPTVPLFRVFYKLSKQGDWFSFQSRTRKGSDPFPKSNKYNEQDAAKLREVAISLHKPYNSLLYVSGLSFVWKEAGRVHILKGLKREVLTMAEFLRLLDLHGCKIVAEALLPPSAALKTHLSTSVVRLEDVPPKTRARETAKVAYRKVIADREKKKRKTKATSAAKAKDDGDVHSEEQGSPLDLVKANEESVAGGKKGNGDDDANVIIEGHGDTANGLSGSYTQPIPLNRSGPRVESVRKSMRDKAPLDVEASYSVGRFGNLPFTPQWGLTDSSRMVRLEELDEEKKEAE
nr:hypothetical protein [Tanacetum cinerariifolium]